MDSTAGIAKLSNRSHGIIVAYGALLYFVALGSNRVLTLHEALFAQAAKESVASGNWITTTYGGAYFNHKPPLTNWLLAALFSVFEAPNEWILRAPFALAALATAIVIGRLAARRHGNWIGLLAGLIQLTMYYSLMQGRLAESDILLCAFVTLAIASFAKSRIPAVGHSAVELQTQRSAILAFYVAAGLAFLSKGPIGLVFTFLPTIAWTLVERDWAAWRLCLRPLPLLIFTALVCGWPYLAWRADPNIFETWRLHNLGRFVGEMGGRKPPLFYAYTVPYLLLPWTPCLALGLWLGWNRGMARDPLWRLLALTFCCGFAVLSAAVWQYKHYLVPILPCLSVIAACGLSWALDRSNFVLSPQVRGTDSVTAVSHVVAAPQHWGAMRKATIAFATIGAAVVFVEMAILPRFDSYRDQTEFARAVNAALPADERLYLVDLIENQITYYLRMPLQRIDEPELLGAKLAAAAAGDVVFVVGPERLSRQLGTLGRVEAVKACPTYRAIMKPEERITLFRLTRTALANAGETPQNR